MKGNQVLKGRPTCGVIFTGEYLVGLGSDAARLLPVELTTPVNSVKFDECRRKPLVLSTFISYYITWYIENYASIQSSLEEWWGTYQQTDMGVHGRLKETHFFLATSYKLFLRYLFGIGLITDEVEFNQYRFYEDLLTRLVQKQHLRVMQHEERVSARVDALELIRALYKDGGFYLAKNKRRFEGTPEKYDGLVHKDLLCLRSEKLLMLFKKAGFNSNLSDIRNTLLAKEALWLDSEGKNKKLGNLRVIGIYLNKLV